METQPETWTLKSARGMAPGFSGGGLVLAAATRAAALARLARLAPCLGLHS